MKEITIASVFIQQLLDGAEKQGHDCQPILLRHGISKLSLDNQNRLHNRVSQPSSSEKKIRVPLESFAAVAIDIMKLLDDEFMGLTAQKQRLGSFNMMCRACISAKSINRSLHRAANFWNLFANTYRHSVVTDTDQSFYRLTLINSQGPVNHYVAESLLSTVHRFHCWLADQFIPPTKVYLSCARPDHADELRALFYGASIDFDQPFDQIGWDTRYGNLEIVQSPDTLDQYLRGTNLSLLYQPKNYRVISDQVRQWLEKNIRQGNYHATLKQAARHFQMSQQVLHRRLQREDISFKEIKMQIRRDIAINLLFADKYKVEQIATLVGFSEPSAFIRAFKSWTGATPLNFRLENHRSNIA